MDIITSSVSINAPEVAVSVKSGFMKYGRGQTVLKDFNMTVPCGTIYSLLGPSGCGKTTVLSAIVGVQSLTSGNVEIFGKRPGTSECGVPGPVLGYMPQGITLYDNLTILEMFFYFGRIYGMIESAIKAKLGTLESFLSLPQSSSKISSLSGGQQRRVSLALCLMHDPKLLILDEPTVGVDPLLRERIWSYLHRMVDEQKVTVIITTHYVEETKDSNKIGVMRNGSILIEESPRVLMKQYNSPYLEEIVTKLFKAANEDDSREDPIVCLQPPQGQLSSVEGTYFRKIDPEIHLRICVENNNKSPSVLPSGNEKYKTNTFHTSQNNNLKLRSSKYSRVKALVVRDVLTFIRNPLFLYLFLLLPSLNGSLVHFIIGVPPVNLKFGFVSPEISNYSNSAFSNAPAEGCSELSYNYIQRLTSTIISPVQMESEQAALESVTTGETRGFLKFARNYSDSLIGRLIAGNFAENESLKDSEIIIRLDQSDYVAAYYLRKRIYKTYLEFVTKAIEVCNSNERSWITKLALNFRKPVYGKDDESSSFVSQTVLLLITFFIPMMSTSHNIIEDRKNGTMDRTLVAGVSKLDFILAMTITQAVLILLQTSVSYVVGSLVLNWDIQGSHLSVIALMFVTGVFGMAASFLLAQFCEHEMEAILIAIGVFVSHLSITGIVWPLEGLGSPIQRFLINLTPLNWAIDALRSVIVRGWPLYHSKVYPAILILLLAVLLSLTLGSKTWRRV